MAQEMNYFIDACRSHHLTIADVKSLNPGDTLEVVMWDKNFDENYGEEKENLKPCHPQEFFQKNKGKIIYRGDMTWDITFPWGETFEHPIHLDVSNLDTNWKWGAISKDDQKIHITNEIVNEGEEIPSQWEEKHIHLSKFPENTRIGWRGPMALWSKLAELPQVYHQH